MLWNKYCSAYFEISLQLNYAQKELRCGHQQLRVKYFAHYAVLQEFSFRSFFTSGDAWRPERFQGVEWSCSNCSGAANQAPRGIEVEPSRIISIWIKRDPTCIRLSLVRGIKWLVGCVLCTDVAKLWLNGRCCAFEWKWVITCCSLVLSSDLKHSRWCYSAFRYSFPAGNHLLRYIESFWYQTECL